MRLLSASLLLLVTVAPGRVPAQSPADARARQVDSLFARWNTTESPGASVAVIYDGEVVLAKGYGMASLEQDVPIRPTTVFDIASVSKQFGAMAIALLEADGRLAFTDDVRKYVPELPDFGHVITIDHLLHHTSGLRDWPGTLRMGGWSFEDVMSFDQILRMAYAQKSLNFPPGDDYAYSNTGYNVLAEVVQRITKQSFRQFTEDRIFRPLGMTSTLFMDDHREIVHRLAESYTPDRGGNRGYLHVTNNLTALASSSLHTTVLDLVKWVRNFETAEVGGRAVIEGSLRRGILNRGDTIPYALGQVVGSYRGLRTVSHGGSWAGYRSTLTRFPDQRFAVIILANRSDANPGTIAQRIADIYLADRLGAQETATAERAADSTEPWTPSAAELAAFAGEYRSDELDTSWHFRVEDGKLVASHFRIGDTPVRVTGRDRFNAPALGGALTFQRDRRGRITGFVSNSVRIRGFLFRRVGERPSGPWRSGRSVRCGTGARAFGTARAERSLYDVGGPSHRSPSMPVTAKLSQVFYDRLGEQVANELVDWFNAVDATYRGNLQELNELNFARFDAKVEQRLAELRADLRTELARLEATMERRFGEQGRWLAAGWFTLLAAIIGLWIRR